MIFNILYIGHILKHHFSLLAVQNKIYFINCRFLYWVLNVKISMYKRLKKLITLVDNSDMEACAHDYINIFNLAEYFCITYTLQGWIKYRRDVLNITKQNYFILVVMLSCLRFKNSFAIILFSIHSFI